MSTSGGAGIGGGRVALAQPPLFATAVAGLEPIEMAEANWLLTRWGHYLGPCSRPFGQEGWALSVGGQAVAVAVSASIVSAHIRMSDICFARGEVVELARLCSGEKWATRPMLRLWREIAAPRWSYWPVRAAVAYSASRRHGGDLYRWDGWTLAAEGAGSSGGGTWSRSRSAADAVTGPKRCWVWQYATAQNDSDGGA